MFEGNLINEMSTRMYGITEEPILFDEEFASYMRKMRPKQGQYFIDSGRLNITHTELEDGSRMMEWKLWVQHTQDALFLEDAETQEKTPYLPEPYEYAYDELTQEVVVMYVTPEGALLNVTRISVPSEKDETVTIRPTQFDGRGGTPVITVHKTGTVNPFQEITPQALNSHNETPCGETVMFMREKASCGRPEGHKGNCYCLVEGTTRYIIKSSGGSEGGYSRLIGVILHCKECDLPHLQNHRMDNIDGLCSLCAFWTEQKIEPGSLIYKGRHYRWGPLSGFGGMTFTVTTLTDKGEPGYKFRRAGLWSQGQIPEHFRDRFPDNAIIQGL